MTGRLLTVEMPCPYCDGLGYTVGHEDVCYSGEGCCCSGVPRECPSCNQGYVEVPAECCGPSCCGMGDCHGCRT